MAGCCGRHRWPSGGTVARRGGGRSEAGVNR
jgi:hypothetical protein